MKKAVFVFIILLVFAACLVIGIQVGSVAVQSPPKTGGEAPEITAGVPVTAEHQQRSLLVLFVDQLDHASPHLQGAWLVLYRPDFPEVSLVAMYPAGSGMQADSAAVLANSFDLDWTGAPAPAFFDTLAQFNVRWDSYILFDQDALAQWIDSLGGIDLGQGSVDGSAALQALANPEQDPQAALESQRRLGAGLCAKMNTSAADPEQALALALVPSLARTNINTTQLLSDWQYQLETGIPVSCEFPTP